jgi:molybdenum cofactor cytidylyltransferase
MHCTGILLAAGRGRRFDPSGLQNKLLQALPDGDRIVMAAARRLSQALNTSLVVVHPDEDSLIAMLASGGHTTTRCPDAAAGMGHSLAHGVRVSDRAPGWIIALGDMPRVRVTTIIALDTAIRNGADIAVPVHDGRRGNPIGFSREHRAALLQVRGDLGARHLLREFPVTEVEVDDPGIFFDVDVMADLYNLA